MAKIKQPAYYDEGYWINLFRDADDRSKKEIAVAWLRHNLTHFAVSDESTSDWLVDALATHNMPLIRDMVWAIPPPGHPVLAQTALQAVPTGAKHSDWLRRFYTTDIPLVTTEPGFEQLGLIRDMWLQPTADRRRGALMELSKSPRHLDGMGISFDSMVRDNAWDIAVENGMAADVVDAATKLTVWTYRGDAVTAHVPSDIANAFLLTALRSERGPLMSLRQITDAAVKKLLTPYPNVCCHMLLLIDERAKLHGLSMPANPTPVHGEASTPDARVKNLRTWFTSESAVVDTAVAVGMSYRDVLDQLSQRIDPAEALPLPIDIAAPNT